RRDREDPRLQRRGARRIESGEPAQHADERLLRQILAAMARAPREQPPDQPVRRLLEALDQIAPRALIAALRSAERQLVERLGAPDRGRVHLPPLPPATSQKVPNQRNYPRSRRTASRTA